MFIDMQVVPVRTTKGERYLVLLIDDFSRKIFGFLTTRKTDVLPGVKRLLLKLDNEKYPKKLAFLRGDGEFNTQEWRAYLDDKGVQLAVAPPHNQWQNAPPERMGGIIIKRAKKQIDYAGANKIGAIHLFG